MKRYGKWGEIKSYGSEEKLKRGSTGSEWMSEKVGEMIGSEGG